MLLPLNNARAVEMWVVHAAWEQLGIGLRGWHILSDLVFDQIIDIQMVVCHELEDEEETTSQEEI